VKFVFEKIEKVTNKISNTRILKSYKKLIEIRIKYRIKCILNIILIDINGYLDRLVYIRKYQVHPNGEC
jgi:hypothetical protein